MLIKPISKVLFLKIQSLLIVVKFCDRMFQLDGATALMQLSGIGKMKPNVVLMGFKRDWDICPAEDLEGYFGVIQ